MTTQGGEEEAAVSKPSDELIEVAGADWDAADDWLSTFTPKNQKLGETLAQAFARHRTAVRKAVLAEVAGWLRKLEPPQLDLNYFGDADEELLSIFADLIENGEI